MEPLDFTRARILNNIPAKKLEEKLSIIRDGNDTEEIKLIKQMAVNRYAASNIPIEYWGLSIDKDFIGDLRLKEKYNEYVADIKSSYIKGASICFAGGHGRGKTFISTAILKKAAQTGYSCLYSTLNDIVSILTQASNEDKFLAKRELVMVDFLVIDELDPRFMANDKVEDLFARNLEHIFRTRSSNKLPTLICTNSPNILESFNGSLKSSLESLMKGYMETFIVFGEDYRKYLPRKYSDEASESLSKLKEEEEKQKIIINKGNK